MSKPVGGRGRKAPYSTAIVRVPTPLLPTVERLSDGYREAHTEFLEGDIAPFDYAIISRREAADTVDSILRKKKSAKQSLEYLLQVLFPVESKS